MFALYSLRKRLQRLVLVQQRDAVRTLHVWHVYVVCLVIVAVLNNQNLPIVLVTLTGVFLAYDASQVEQLLMRVLGISSEDREDPDDHEDE